MPPILVIGEALVDRLPSGPVAGGAPFNVARSLAALGATVCCITRMGAADADAALLLHSAQQFGLSAAGFQRDAHHATGAVTVHMHNHTHQFEIHDDAAWDYLETEQALHVLQALPAPPAVVYFGTLAQRKPTSRDTIRTVLDSTNALRYLDLNLRAPFASQLLVEESLLRADWLKVNDEELLQLLAWFAPPGNVDRNDVDPYRLAPGVSHLMQQFQLQRVVLTLGARGWATYDEQGVFNATGAASPVTHLVDTVGAGDAFSAMVLAAHNANLPWSEALPLAAGFAAALCGQRGPMPEDAAFFQPWRQRLVQGHDIAKPLL